MAKLTVSHLLEAPQQASVTLRQMAKPSGLSKDGAASIYHRLALGAGTHRIAVRMSDDARRSDFGHVLEQTVTLKPAQILVIDFDTATQTITLQ